VLFLKVKPTVTLPDGLVTVGDGAEGSTSVTRNREVDGDGKKREGDDDRDGGVTGDEEELGEQDCPALRKELDSATRDTWKRRKC
jgi:hypothetical protein